MNQRFTALPRNQKIGVGVVALLLSCGLCSRLGGGNKPAITDKPTEVAATDEHVKVDATATGEAEVTATEAATATKDATATEEPTLEPATAVPAQPTALPAYMSLDPGQDRDCDEFPSQADAQAYWQAHRTADRPNPGRLDGNGNSNVCEDPDRAVRQAPAPVEAASPPAAPSSGCVNFNSAGYDELRRIKYVEDKIANEILAKRPFSGWSDLVKKVNGIGENNVKEIQAEGIGCF